MNMTWLRSAFVCFLLALYSQSSHAADEPQGYQLSVERPEVMGNYYAFKTELYHSIHTIESRDGQPQGEVKKTVEAQIVGNAWVSDATDQGEIAEVLIYPETFTVKVNGAELKLNVGDRLYVQMDNGVLKVFDSNGQSVSSEVMQVVGSLLAFMLGTDESELSDNQMLALDKPRRPGQSWQCDHQSLAGSLNKTWEIEAEPDQIKSALTFTKVDKLLGEDAANLELEVELKRFTIPALTMRGLSVEKSAGSVKVQRVIPIKDDSLNGKVSRQVDLSATASADLPDQGRVQVQMTTTLKSQAEYRIQE